MDRTPQNGERLSESHQLQLYVIDKRFITIWLIVRCLFWIAIAYIVFLAIKELAGQTTVASFFLSYLTSDDKSGSSPPFIWIALAIIFFIWAKFERWLRHRKVESMSERIELLELKLDPNRTSSGLLPSGETPVEERLP